MLSLQGFKHPFEDPLKYSSKSLSKSSLNNPGKTHVLNIILSVILSVILNVIPNIILNVILMAKINGTWLEFIQSTVVEWFEVIFGDEWRVDLKDTIEEIQI